MKAPIYLIPHDFSPVAETALQLGLDLAKHNNGSILMVHFVDKRTAVKEAKDNFTSIVEALPEADRALITTRVLTGNIYDSIAMASELIGASLIVMGTHGAKGLQKLFGSHALKLVSNTHVPFIITQGSKPEGNIKNIIMPYYFERESMQIAGFAGFIAKQFDATIHLVGSTPKDEWNKEHMNANRQVLHKFFAEHSVTHELINLPLENSYEKELLDYAESVNGDLIAVSYYNQSILPTMHTFVQELIENDKQIPVLTVNAEDLTITSGYFFIST
jgi:nucleotide-binding universal stress UspA family protein